MLAISTSALPHDSVLVAVPSVEPTENANEGGFTAGEPPASIVKRAPGPLETDAPPGTAWQNSPDGFVWDNMNNKKSFLHCSRKDLLNDPYRDRVIEAWGNAKALARAAKESLDRLCTGSPEYQLNDEKAQCVDGPVGSSASNLCMWEFVARNHPAYTQLFAANPEMIGTSEYDLIHNGPPVDGSSRTELWNDS